MLTNKNKFCVAVDCEGIACVANKKMEKLQDDPFVVRQATEEANAAARALFDRGAAEVIILDTHHAGMNLDYERIDNRCRIMLGSGNRIRFPEIDAEYAGILFIGFHSREGTKDAVLAHSYGPGYQYMKINGQEVGEMEMEAAFPGRFGVPVIFISSDDKTVDQAKKSFPWAETVAVKKSLGRTSVLSMHPEAARNAIYSGVMRACERIDEMKPYTFSLPMEVEFRFSDMAGANSPYRGLYDNKRRPFEFVDAFTRRGTMDNIEDLFN